MTKEELKAALVGKTKEEKRRILEAQEFA